MVSYAFDSTRSTAVRDGAFRLRQHRRNAIRVTDVEQHAFRHDASHLPRGEVDYEERLPSDQDVHIRTLFFQASKDRAIVIAEADHELHEFLGVRDVDDVTNRPDPDIQFREVIDRYGRLDRCRGHSLADRGSRDVATLLRCRICSRWCRT